MFTMTTSESDSLILTADAASATDDGVPAASDVVKKPSRNPETKLDGSEQESLARNPSGDSAMPVSSSEQQQVSSKDSISAVGAHGAIDFPAAVPLAVGAEISSQSLSDAGIAVSHSPVQRKDLESPLCVDFPVTSTVSRKEDELKNVALDDPSTTVLLPLPSTSPPPPDSTVYHVKWIKWKDNKVSIIMQNENGPCPLIAIMNVLILKGKVQLPPMIEMITADQLMDYLGDCILEYTPKNISEGAQLNYEQNMHDAMAVLPKLQTGLDVNVKFSGVSDFEYTPECIIFDLLNIPLFHGWLVDPQLHDVVSAVGNSSYNQLVERIITDKASPNEEVVTRALIAESFLERAASQLTYHGLCELNAAIRDEELCVLFRNNHFSTILKHKHELFQLVTDQGFLTESTVIWETLSNIDGDGQFVDSGFINVPPKSGVCSAPVPPVSADQQIDQDYLVALSLQEEQQRHVEQEVAWQEYKEKQLGVDDSVSDEELARRLQQEEQQQVDAAPAAARGGAGTGQASSSTSERHSEGKKKSDCVIL